MSNVTIVKKVKIRNILSHENTEITFPLGLIALVGPNGAGKSSIVDSIVYSLFYNPQSAKGFRGSSKRSLLRTGASDGLIEVELSVGGRTYIVQRSIGVSRPENAMLIEVEDNKKKILASGISKVLGFINEILGIPSSEAIRYTIVSRQNELTAFIEDTASSRRETILKLLGLDEIEKAKDLLKDHLKKIEGDIKLFEELNRQYEDIKKQLEELNNIINEKLSRREKLSKEVQMAFNELKSIEKVKDLVYRYNELKTLKEIVIELNKLRKLQDLCSELNKLELGEMISALEIYGNAKKRIDELNKQLYEIDIKVKNTIDRIKNVSNFEFKENKIDEIVEAIERYLDEVKRIKHTRIAEVKFNEDSINVLKNSTVCPLCKRELNDSLKNQLINDIVKHIESLKNSINDIDRIENDLKKMLDDIKKYNVMKVEIRSKISELENQMSKAVSRYSNIQQKIQNVIENAKNVEEFSECFTSSESTTLKLAQCLQRKAIEIIRIYNEKINLIKRLRLGKEIDFSNLDKIVEEFNNTEKELFVLGIEPDKVDYNDIELKYRELSIVYNNMSQELSRIDGEIKAHIKHKADMENRLRDIEERLRELRKSVEIYKVVDMLVNRLLGKDGIIAKILTAEAKRLIELYTNRILHELGLDFSIDIDENFNIEVKSSSGELDIRGLSGGETVALAIALRIATAYTIFGKLPGFFILDEPTQFLDLNRRRTLFEIIKRLSERIPQVIIVTHDADVIDLADKVFYVNKIGGKSVVVEKIIELEAMA
jgi:exonuclease SbcC